MPDPYPLPSLTVSIVGAAFNAVLTFPVDMNALVKPPNVNWVWHTSGGSMTTFNGNWLDARRFTLTGGVNPIVGQPVTLDYLGSTGINGLFAGTGYEYPAWSGLVAVVT